LDQKKIILDVPGKISAYLRLRNPKRSLTVIRFGSEKNHLGSTGKNIGLPQIKKLQTLVDGEAPAVVPLEE
jgi:hypothetical protein